EPSGVGADQAIILERLLKRGAPSSKPATRCSTMSRPPAEPSGVGADQAIILERLLKRGAPSSKPATRCST
ncbi:hypothetical protein CTI14_71445, partial [Methylobacterium radiotolerans]